MPQPCLDILSMSRFSTDAVSDTYTCRDLDNMTTAVRRAEAFIKQHTFCSSITSANFDGGGRGSRLALAMLTQVGDQNLGKLNIKVIHEHSRLIFLQRMSSIKVCLPSKLVLIEGCLPSMVVYQWWSSSIKGHLPLRVIFHHRLSCYASYLTLMNPKIIIFFLTNEGGPVIFRKFVVGQINS